MRTWQFGQTNDGEAPTLCIKPIGLASEVEEKNSRCHAKNGHSVPLSPQAMRLLEQVRKITEEQDKKADRKRSEWVFPNSIRRDDHIYECQGLVQRVRRESKVECSAHDSRRTAASKMAAMGISPLVVSKILNHVEPGVTKVYDRYGYDKEKQEALNTWGARLGRIVSGLELVKAENGEG